MQSSTGRLRQSCWSLEARCTFSFLLTMMNKILPPMPALLSRAAAEIKEHDENDA